MRTLYCNRTIPRKVSVFKRLFYGKTTIIFKSLFRALLLVYLARGTRQIQQEMIYSYDEKMKLPPHRQPVVIIFWIMNILVLLSLPESWEVPLTENLFFDLHFKVDLIFLSNLISYHRRQFECKISTLLRKQKKKKILPNSRGIADFFSPLLLSVKTYPLKIFRWSRDVKLNRTRVEKILEQLSKTWFFTGFEFPALFSRLKCIFVQT